MDNINKDRITPKDSLTTRPFVQIVDHPLEVEESQRPYLSKHNIEIFDSQHTLIGGITLRKNLQSDKPDHPRPRVAMIDEIHLEQPYIGKGFGKSAYLELLKFLGDMPLMSANTNDFSVNIWQSLVRDGLAEEEYIELDGQRKMVGYISLPDAVKSKLIDPTSPK